MIKKLTALFAVMIIILSVFTCCKNEPAHKTGWNNPEEPKSEATTIAEDTTADHQTTEANAQEVTIRFSSDKAVRVGDFQSEVYGKLVIYFQDDHFLIFDEYQERRFTIFAEGYSPSKTDGKPVALFDDMNFDGYTDFGVCYYKDALNSYYFCFMWDNGGRTFRYQLSLSNLANPDFDPVTNEITAYERFTTTTASEKKYTYTNGVLTHISSKDVVEEPVTDGAETVDANLQVTGSGSTATLILDANEISHSKWVCTIENENVAVLSSEYYNEEASAYEFRLTAVSPGATTVIFRYKSVVTGEYIEEIIINAITKEDMTLQIVVPQ